MKNAAVASLTKLWNSDPKFLSVPERAAYAKFQLGNDSESPFVWEHWDKDPEASDILSSYCYAPVTSSSVGFRQACVGVFKSPMVLETFAVHWTVTKNAVAYAAPDELEAEDKRPSAALAMAVVAVRHGTVGNCLELTPCRNGTDSAFHRDYY